jgi:hypothetical protein
MSEHEHEHVEDEAPPPPVGYGSAVAHDQPPPRRGPRPSQQQQQQQGWGPGGPRDLPPHLRDPFARGDGRYGGPDPFQLLQHPTDSNVVRVERVRCNGDETDETGFCGIVARTMGFEQEIRHKWGGGQYIVTTTVNGRAEDRPVNIGGVSKPLAATGDEEAEQGEGEGEGGSAYDHSSDDYYPSSYRYRGRRYGSYYDDDPYEPGYGGRFGRGGRFGGGYGQGGNGFGGGGFGGGGGGGGGFSPYQPQGPYQQQGFGPYQQQPQAPYQQPGLNPYQQPGYYQPSNPWQTAAQAGPPGMVPVPGAPPNVYMPAQPERDNEREEQLEALRIQIEAAQEEARQAREDAAAEREERRLELERSQAKEREMELRREMDQIRADQQRRDEEFRRQVEEARRQSEQQMQQMIMEMRNSQANKGTSMADRLVEMQMANLAAAQQRTEQERMERAQRQREEAILRREEEDRREKERNRADEVREGRRHEERLREEQRRQDERLRDEQRRREADAHYQQLITMFQGSQQKPTEMLGLLEKLVNLRPEKDTFEEIQKLAGVAMMVKDLVGSGEPQQEGKWESIIRTGSEALGRAIGDIQAKRAAQEDVVMQQVAMQQGYPQQGYPVAQQQHPALPGPQPGYNPQPPQVAYAPPVEPTLQEPTGPEWGRILGFAVDAHDSGNDPETTATHLHTMVNVGMERPKALEQLEGGTTDELRLKLSAMLMSADVARSRYKVKIDRMLEILNIEMTAEHKADPEQEVYGREWVEELLRGLSEIQQAMREAVAQIHRAEVHAPQHAPQQYAAPVQPHAQVLPQQADPSMDPASFAAQSRGPVVTPPPAADPNMDPAAFAAQSRGPEDVPPADPTNGWG